MENTMKISSKLWKKGFLSYSYPVMGWWASQWLEYLYTGMEFNPCDPEQDMQVGKWMDVWKMPVTEIWYFQRILINKEKYLHEPGILSMCLPVCSHNEKCIETKMPH